MFSTTRYEDTPVTLKVVADRKKKGQSKLYSISFTWLTLSPRKLHQTKLPKHTLLFFKVFFVGYKMTIKKM